MTHHAMIVGTVEYRQGDGPNIAIRRGPCEVTVTAMDATLSWTEGVTQHVTAVPLADYRRLLTSRALKLLPDANG